MTEAACMALAQIRWKCLAHRIPEAGPEDPQYLFTREPSVDAIGVAHYREIDGPFLKTTGIDFSPALWARARFLSSSLAFVAIVSATDGVYFATIKDFDKDAMSIRPRQLGMDARAKYVVLSEKFKALKPDGANLGPTYRDD